MTASLMVGRADLAARGADIVRQLRGEWTGDRGMCLCPAHDDQAPSLSIRVGDQALLFKCFAGCETIDVLRSIRDATGLVALQRTFLDLERGGLARDLGRARRVLARSGNGAVCLATAEETLGLAEGIETALSAMHILGIPVWATLGADRFARIALPTRITQLILLPDNDPPGAAAEARAMQVYARDGRTIETLWPPEGFKDWNDVLRRRRSPRGVASHLVLPRIQRVG